ncbi:conserved hypothetical protein [Ricinus communis]|uniref:GATA-type domain-containing protein n=1 Tax=Ricinus communis TaxID=3988 RepID=B9RFG5_RICCO|nr:conserved hypothetical protein [Ricinus communis]|eukprot:XP_002512484.1 GATA transcription factor 15 [Ricinus communis]
MDLDERKSSCGDDDKSKNDSKKSCTDCKTTETPLWRAGPAGPKSLCNACGIRYRKTKRDILSFHKSPFKRRKRPNITATTPSSTSTATTSATTNEVRNSLKMRLIVVGQSMLFQRSKIVRKQRCQRRRKLGQEEQQAAFSLMALSCGSVFA